MTYFYLGTILVLLLICIKLHVSKKQLRKEAEKTIGNKSLENRILTVQLQNALFEVEHLKREGKKEKAS